MTALYIILGIIAVIILLLICPVRLKIIYDDGLKLKVGYLFLNFDILSGKNKTGDKETIGKSVKDKADGNETVDKSEKDKKKLSDKTDKKEDKPIKNDNKHEQKKNPILEYKDKHGLGGILGIIKSLLDIFIDIPKKLAKHLVIKIMDIKLLVVGEDSADTAVKYGYVCSVIYPVISILENNLKIKKHKEEIVAGFLAEESVAEITLCAYIRPWFLIGTGISAFVKLVSAIAKIK